MKSFFISIWLSVGCLLAVAQTNGERAKVLLDFYLSGQGDSVYVRLNENIRSQLTPQLLNNTMKELEMQLGSYQKRGDLLTDTVEAGVIYYSDLQFERIALRFLTLFDADGLANTFRLIPVPADRQAPTVLQNTDKFEEKELVVVSGEYRLPATLALPKGVEKPPLVILVHGSGPNDRDESIGPNKVFRDLAWGLVEQGIAVLRYDKRTFVYQTPEAASNYDEEVVDDALAAIEQLKSVPEIDEKRIYIVGHSLGALLAPRIAEQSSGVLAGIVLIAAPARPMEDLLLEQITYITSLAEANEESKQQLEILRKQVLNAKVVGTDAFNERMELPLNVPASYWAFANLYQPVEVAKSLKIPVLILQGERDYQVTMEDFGLWKQNLSHRTDVWFKSYPRLNHALQEGTGKSTPGEYSQENGVSVEVILDIANWIWKKELKE